MQPSTVFNIDDDLSVFVGGAPALTPTQQAAADRLTAGLAGADVNVLRVAAGSGATTILRAVHAEAGGAFMVARRFLNLRATQTSIAIAEAFVKVLTECLSRNAMLFIDDLHLLMPVLGQRMDAVMTVLLDSAAAQGTKFVLALARENEPRAVSQRAIVWEMEEFGAEDYAAIAEYYLGDESARRLNMATVHRSAPALTANELKNACLWLGLREAVPDTKSIIEYLRVRKLSGKKGEGFDFRNELSNAAARVK